MTENERLTVIVEANEAFRELILIDAAKHIKQALVTVNGVETVFPITKTVIRDGFFKHYVELEDEPIGTVEKVIVTNENGIHLGVAFPDYEKGDDGWQMAFKWLVDIKQKVEDDNGI